MYGGLQTGPTPAISGGNQIDEDNALIYVCVRFDLRTLPVDFVECLMRFIPTESELKVLRQYEKERKPLENLTDEDRFMIQFSKIERLMQKMTIMAFLGNFTESVQMLTPVNNTNPELLYHTDSTLGQELSGIFQYSL